MKRIVMFLACLCLVATCLYLLSTEANAATDGYYTYTVSGGEAAIIGVSTSISGAVTIPATLGGYPVTYIGDAFSGCTGLTEVTIPDSVTLIGRSAFSDCSGLTNVIIPDSVTRIGDDAFSGCTGLTSVIIGNGVTSIGNSAFRYCTGLTKVAIPDGVTDIGGFSFGSCTGLTEITIPNSVTTIGSYAFSGCTGLTTVNYNAINCTSMGSDSFPVFSDCLNLATVNIGEKVETIPDYAFLSCTGLTEIAIGNGVTTIGNYAFFDCSGLTEIAIGNGVTSIGERAFYNCTGLTEVTISDSVISIGNRAFGSCTGLTEITIPNSVTTIGSYAFSGCTGLTEIIIPDSVTSIGASAFSRCTGLTSVALLDGVTSIGSSAFSGCTALAEIIIPDSVTGLSHGAFNGCTGLVSVKLGNGITEIPSKAFTNCSSLRSLVIPEGVTIIGDQAFRNCKSLTSVVLPSTLESVASTAFECTQYTDALEYVLYGGTKEQLDAILTSYGRSILDYAKVWHYGATADDVSYRRNCAGEGMYCWICRAFFTGTTTGESCDTTDAVTEPTCTERGYTAHTCKVCYEVITDTYTDPTGHTYHSEVTAPTCTEQGYTTHTCEICRHTVADTYTAVLPHKYKEVVTASTCVEQGYTTYTCQDCNHTYVDAYTEPTGVHTYEAEVTKPTCIAQGYTTHTCTLCPDTYIDAYTQPTGVHIYKPLVVAPGCTTWGYTGHICEYCGISYQTDHLSPAGHKFSQQGGADGHICLNCGGNFPKIPVQYRITLKDVETGEALEDVVITLGDELSVTDLRGEAFFQLDSDETTSLQILAMGYPEYKKSYYRLEDVRQDTIYLEAADVGICEVTCNGKDILDGFLQINAMAYQKTTIIEVTGRSNAQILNYELVQGGEIIAKSTNGKFIVPNGHFKRGEFVYVRMHTNGEEGHNVYQRLLNIRVAGLNIDLETDWGKLLPFNMDLQVEFPNGMPILEKLKVKIPRLFGEKHSLGVEVGNDKIVISVTEKGGPNRKNEEKTKDQIFTELVNDWIAKTQKDKENKTTATMAIVIEFDENGVTAVYGQLLLKVDLEFSTGKSFMLWIVPVRVEFETSLEGKLAIDKITYDFDKNQIAVPNLDIDFDGRITGRFGVGCSVLSAGLYGEARVKMGTRYIPRPSVKYVYTSGEIGVYVKVKVLFFKAKTYTHTLLHGQYVNPSNAVVPSLCLYNIDDYEETTRAYLKARSPWLNAISFDRSDDAQILLQTYVYDRIEPKIVTAGDTTMMLFMDDDGTEGYNYQHLYFSIYDKETNTWRAPQKVDDNLYPDIEFDVCSDEKGIHVLYTQSDKITEENLDNDVAVANSIEVSYVRYDEQLGRFVDYAQVSHNEGLDLMPNIVAKDGTLTAVWVNNPTGDVFIQNANNMIYSAFLRNGKWSEPEALTEPGATITSMDVGVLDDAVHTAVIRDVDCDMSTTEDRVAEVLDMQGNSYKMETDVNYNDGIQFATIDGKKVLVWYNGGNLYCIETVEDTPEELFAMPADGFSGKYRVVATNGTTAVIYTKTDSTQDENGEDIVGSDLYGIFLHDGQWSAPVRISRTVADAYIDSFDVLPQGDKLLIPYVCTQVVFNETDFTTTSHFLSTSMTLDYDLVMNGISALPSDLLNSSQIPVTMELTNNSWEAIRAVAVDVKDANGKVVYSTTREVSIPAGETKDVSVTFDRSTLSEGESYTLCCSISEHTDVDMSNNTAPLTIWYTELKVTAQQVVEFPSTQKLQYAVTNCGNLAGDGTLSVYKKVDGTEVLLYSEKLAALTPNETRTGSIVITADYYGADGESGTVYVNVEAASEELYTFDNMLSVAIRDISYQKLEAVDPEITLYEKPVLEQGYVVYERFSDMGPVIKVQEKGCRFVGIENLAEGQYRYDNGVLTLDKDWLDAQQNMHLYLNLLFEQAGHSTQALLAVEIEEPLLQKPILSVESTKTIPYDGSSIKVGVDLRISSESKGKITTAYSVDGQTWFDGLPADIGVYQIRIMQAADLENHYDQAEELCTIEIIKGNRAISAPRVIANGSTQMRFGGAIPTAGIGDGTVLYGYSFTNSVNDVEQWSEEGVLPAEGTQTYYIFAKICEGVCYEQAFSNGTPVTAHKHNYEEKIVAPTCVDKGYTLHTCTECKVTYKDQHTDPTGKHDFEDGSCTFCGAPAYVPGDLDGVEGVTDADAVYLLYHTFLPGLYPVDQDCDFNGDGEVNDADAVHLLYYTFLPDLYPLH